MAWILGVAVTLRLVAAAGVSWYVARVGKPCVFPDTIIYWELARAIVAGDPYRVFQGGAPHYALRTPGFPLFLAGCRLLFGASLPGVRIVQAILGTMAVWLVCCLIGAVFGVEEVRRKGWTLGWIGAAMVAIDPYVVGCRRWCYRRRSSSP